MKKYKWMIPTIWRNGKKRKFIEYRINRQGIIKRFKLGGNNQCKKGTLKIPYLHHSGYIYVNLFLNKKQYIIPMHRLMYETWTGRIIDQINHKDCDKTNYQLYNLEDISMKKNMEHASKNGRMCMSKKTKKKISKALKNRKFTDEHKNRISEGLKRFHER